MLAKCNLEFDEFEIFLRRALKEIFEANMFTDITLVGDDHIPIEAHRVILSAHSSVLREKISKSSSARPTLHCRGSVYQDLNRLIQFMYLGQVSLPLGQSNDLLKLSKYLQVNQLGDNCQLSQEEINQSFSMIELTENIDEIEEESSPNISENIADTEESNLKMDSPNICENIGDTEEESNSSNCDEDEDDQYNLAEVVEKKFGINEDSFVICVETNQEKTYNDIEASYNDDQNEESMEDFKSAIETDSDVNLEYTNSDYQLSNTNYEAALETDYGAEMVGTPIPGFPPGRTVFYTHRYFVKLKTTDGSRMAQCLMCKYNIDCDEMRHFAQRKRKKLGFLKVNSGTTKPLITHVSSTHPNIFEKYLKQQEIVSRSENNTRKVEMIQKERVKVELLKEERRNFKRDMEMIKKNIQDKDKAAVEKLNKMRKMLSKAPQVRC